MSKYEDILAPIRQACDHEQVAAVLLMTAIKNGARCDDPTKIGIDFNMQRKASNDVAADMIQVLILEDLGMTEAIADNLCANDKVVAHVQDAVNDVINGAMIVNNKKARSIIEAVITAVAKVGKEEE